MAFSKKLAKGVVLTVALGLSVVLAAGIWQGKTLNQKEPEGGPSGEKTEAEMKLTDMEYTEMQQGHRVWTLKAAEAKYFQEEQKTHLSSVNLTFFLENGDELLLRSEEGILYAGSKNIELWKSVQAVLPQGYQLSTDRVTYNHQQQLVASDTLIRLVGPDVSLQGERWEYRIPERLAVLDGGVKASVVFMSSAGTSAQ